METDIERIQVGHFEFGRESNAYLLRQGEAAVLIDAGVGNEGAYSALAETVERLDTSLEDLSDVLLTHWHADHAGLAGRLDDEHDVRIHIHERDAEMVRRNADVFDSLRADQRTLLREWRVPEDDAASALALLQDPSRIHGRPADVTTFRDRAEFEFGDLRIRARHTPGHTAGHSSFLLERGSTTCAFVGDTVLPRLTPNIGGTDIRMDRPLDSFRDSIDRLMAMNPDRLYPGHSSVIEHPDERCSELRSHHEQRQEALLERIGDNSMSVWDLTIRTFDEVTGVDVIQATGEVYAHIVELVHSNEVSYDDGMVTSR